MKGLLVIIIFLLMVIIFTPSEETTVPVHSVTNTEAPAKAAEAPAEEDSEAPAEEEDAQVITQHMAATSRRIIQEMLDESPAWRQYEFVVERVQIVQKDKTHWVGIATISSGNQTHQVKMRATGTGKEGSNVYAEIDQDGLAIFGMEDLEAFGKQLQDVLKASQAGG